MTSKRIRWALAATLVLSLAGASLALAGGTRGHHKGGGPFQSGTQFQAHLTGYQEVPSINSTGQGDLSLTVGNNQLSFQLTYSGISPNVAHVHVAQPGVNGGVSFYLCGGGGKPACPAPASGSSVTISGTVLPADVQAIPAQNFPAGDLNPVIAAMRAGVTYANMHTTAFPAGEIRGQLVPGFGKFKGDKGNKHDDDHD
jgi:hypothetical protein